LVEKKHIEQIRNDVYPTMDECRLLMTTLRKEN